MMIEQEASLSIVPIMISSTHLSITYNYLGNSVETAEKLWDFLGEVYKQARIKDRFTETDVDWSLQFVVMGSYQLMR